MRATSFLVLCCILKCAGVVLATCTVSKYEEGYGDLVQCSNESLSTVLSQSANMIGAIMVFKSSIPYIPERSFVKYGKSLMSLNVHDCSVRDVHNDAFQGLTYLKKLSLPNNKIAQVKEGWFADAISLEQLDLSYNSIERIEPTTFSKLRALKRLDARENRLTCLDPVVLQPMGGIDKFYFSGNPLSFQCRAKLTLWLRDHGVNYYTDRSGKESWLDKALWMCKLDDAKVAESEMLMKECVLLNLFNQLRTGLETAVSFPLTVPQDCVYARNLLTECVVNRGKLTQPALTNGNTMMKLLLDLRDAKSARQSAAAAL